MTVYLIRHGETELTSTHCYQGVTDTPLSDDGKSKIKKSAFEPRKVYVSPLVRCRETAEIMFPNAEITQVSAFSEMNFGDFEGKNWHDMENDSVYRAWVDGMCLGQCPNGESREEFSNRVCAAFNELISKTDENEIFIVAHGGTQMAVLERWGKPERDYYDWCAKPGAGYVLCADEFPEALTLVGEI